MKKTFFLILCSTQVIAQSNYLPLLNKRYNEVTFPCTHNGQSDKGPNLKTFTSVQNQEKSIKEQLRAGIRGIKLPLFLQDNMVLACHGVNHHVVKDVREKVDAVIKKLHIPSFLRSAIEKLVEPLLPKGFADIYFHPERVKPCYIDPGMKEFKSILNDIRTFLEENPSEILTLFLEVWIKTENDPQKLILDVCKESQIDHYLHTQDKNSSWPLLRELISTKKRLVFFLDIEVDQSRYPFNEYRKPTTWSSPYNFNSAEKLKNDPADKGPSQGWYNQPSRIWILQHFVTKLTGGSINDAIQVNQKKIILRRIEKYRRAHNLPNPTFIWVDFFNQPSIDVLFVTIDTLNGVRL